MDAPRLAGASGPSVVFEATDGGYRRLCNALAAQSSRGPTFNSEMSALGHKQTCAAQQLMSALGQ
jgi:hypothetical protein